MLFKDLPLAEPLLRAAADAGYTQPSPIQEKAIPPVVAGRDILGCAQTGTGKTAAFAMPILQLLSQAPCKPRKIRALILTPTRELAIQIDDSFAAYSKYMQMKHCVIFGGVNQNPQVSQLKSGVDILTATPGRLNDLIGQGHISLANVEIFVLDEADRMLDMGFVHDVKRVIQQLPAKRQTLFFSATMPPEIAQLASTILHNPVKVMVTPPATTVEKIDQSLYFVDKPNKRFLLASLIKEKKMPSVLVFTRTKHGADKVVRELAKDKIVTMAIHGNKSQNARQDALARFKDGSIRVLVATDIAARGIDISELPFVINYDLPNIPETYVHRIGRTGRAGQEGAAISFCMEDEIPYLKDIEKLTKIKIPVVEDHAWKMQGNAAVEAAKAQQPAPPPRGKKPQRSTEKQLAASAKKPQASKKEKAPAARQAAGQNTRQAPPAKAKEDTSMENNQNAQNAQQPADGAKRRRHRGGRGRNKKPNAAAPQQASANVQSEPRTAPLQAKKPFINTKPTQREIETADVGLELISRRAPATKFSSFADYMANHAGSESSKESGEE